MTARAAVVIPTCNRRDILEESLHALAMQTHPHFEVIVVDDNSQDDTADMVRAVDREHPAFNIRLIRNEENKGANASRNIGAHATGAPIVAFIDSDAIPEQDWLDNLLKPFDNDRVAAVTGLVLDPEPRNIYDRCFQGTHRVPEGDAIRLAGTNMACRRDLLLKYAFDEDRATPDTSAGGAPDTTVSGRGDEEGLFHILKAAGYEIKATHDARVLHVHHYTRRSFFKQALKGGRSAARLVHKYKLPPRLDMLPFALAYITLPVALFDPLFSIVPLFFLSAALAAILWNDLTRKAKSPADTFATFPLLVAYYHTRLLGYASETLRLLFTGRTSEGVKLNRVNLSTFRKQRSA